MEETVKCSYCKEELNKLDGLKDGNVYYHFECFVEKFTNNTKSKKYTNLDVYEITKLADKLLEETKISVINNRKRTEFFDFISEEYCVPKVSKTFVIKLMGIQNGNGESKIPIDLGILKEMMQTDAFKRMVGKAHVRRKSVAKDDLDNEAKAKYDVSVAISKYFSYIRARAEHAEKMAEKERAEEIAKTLSSIKVPTRTMLENGDFDNNKLELEDIYF